MALRIRLMRMGARNKPSYRVVVAESRARRDGKFIEKLGFYDPKKEPPEFDLNQERTLYWIQRGAKPSETVSSLMKKLKSFGLPNATPSGQSERQSGEASSAKSN
jgi:small subunit ribosomal protein S16